jgi:hypothetical protein
MENELQIPVEKPEEVQSETTKSFADFKKEYTQRKTDPPSDQSASNSDSKPEETSTASEPVEQQQEEKKRRDRSAEGRIKELNAEAKRERERAERLEQELRDLRTRKPEPIPQANIQPEPAQQAASASQTRKLNAFLEEYFEKNKAADYEDGLQAYLESIASVNLVESVEKKLEEKRQKELEQKRAEEKQREFQDNLSKAKQKYHDYDAIVAAGIEAAQGIPSNLGYEAAMKESEVVGDLVYFFSKNIDELRRITALDPSAAYRAVVSLEQRFSGNTETAQVATPEKKLPPSYAPPPPAIVGGGSAGSSTVSLTGAPNMREFKKRYQKIHG